MTDAEVLLSSLFSGEEPSLWLDDLSNQNGGTSATKPRDVEETAAADLFKELEQDSLLGNADPLPEWMSEKVSLTSLLQVAETKTEPSLPSVPTKLDLDLATTTEAPIPAEELLNTLFVDTKFAPQPPSPGEAQAPDLLALSPASSLFTEDDLLASSPDNSIIASPTSPVGQVLEPAALNLGGVSLSTIDLSEVIQIQSPTSPMSEETPMNVESFPIEVNVALEPPESEPPKQKSRARPKVKSASDPVKRKSKKRDQNKRAATRYRQKKRGEFEALEDERDDLEKTNKELNDKVDSISREIKYLKDLLAEVYKVKGEIKVMRKK